MAIQLKRTIHPYLERILWSTKDIDNLDNAMKKPRMIWQSNSNYWINIEFASHLHLFHLSKTSLRLSLQIELMKQELIALHQSIGAYFSLNRQQLNLWSIRFLVFRIFFLLLLNNFSAGSFNFSFLDNEDNDPEFLEHFPHWSISFGKLDEDNEHWCHPLLWNIRSTWDEFVPRRRKRFRPMLFHIDSSYGIVHGGESFLRSVHEWSVLYEEHGHHADRLTLNLYSLISRLDFRNNLQLSLKIIDMDRQFCRKESKFLSWSVAFFSHWDKNCPSTSNFW